MYIMIIREFIDKKRNVLMDKLIIRKYESKDSNQLFDLIKREGIEWTYWQGENWAKYLIALAECINYLLFEDEILCGYIRCRNDAGFGIYILDLLVDNAYRGNEYGRLLMEKVCHDHPDDYIFVASDVDPYYEKLGYKKEGTIFALQKGKYD